MNTKHLLIVATLLLSTFAFSSCETTEVPLDKPVIERLEDFHGNNITAVKRQLVGEGFFDLDMGIATGFTKENEQYVMHHNTSDKKTINSAEYTTLFTKSAEMPAKYDALRAEIKKCDLTGYNFTGRISAKNFQDFDKNWIDSIKDTDTTFIYIYDNEMYFSTAKTINFAGITVLSEKWHQGKDNTGKEYGVQLRHTKKQMGSEIIGNVGVINSDFSIK